MTRILRTSALLIAVMSAAVFCPATQKSADAQVYYSRGYGYGRPAYYGGYRPYGPGPYVYRAPAPYYAPAPVVPYGYQPYGYGPAYVAPSTSVYTPLGGVTTYGGPYGALASICTKPTSLG
jgi:hypothetical protein